MNANWHFNPLPRKPDFCIGGTENPYLRRWYILRTPWFGFNLHNICRDDDDRALHDHPWPSVSVILRGGYFEVTPKFGQTARKGPLAAKWHGAGSVIGLRKATDAHRLMLAKNPIDGKPVTAWTLFLVGPWQRDWGFHCPKGWRPWREFCSADDRGSVGRGCD